MIARAWHDLVPADKDGHYHEYLLRTVVQDYRASSRIDMPAPFLPGGPDAQDRKTRDRPGLPALRGAIEEAHPGQAGFLHDQPGVLLPAL